jgi:serine/threonine protein kinase
MLSIEEFNLQYEDIKEELGKGSFGVVKKYKDLKTNNTYALKFMKPSMLNLTELSEEFALRDILLQIDGLVKYHRLFVLVGDNTSYVLVMDFIKGQDLLNLIGSLSIEEMLYITEQLVDTVEKLHEHHLVHRDIKPNNCILDQESKKVVLLDYGFVCTTATLPEDIKAHEKLKKCTKYYGTAVYMSPEVYYAKRGKRELTLEELMGNDVWSLSITLINMWLRLDFIEFFETISDDHPNYEWLIEHEPNYTTGVPLLVEFREYFSELQLSNECITILRNLFEAILVPLNVRINIRQVKDIVHRLVQTHTL